MYKPYVSCFARGPSETVHNGNLIVWACRVTAPLNQCPFNYIKSAILITFHSKINSNTVVDGINTLVLMIANFTEGNAGTYVCRAKNDVSQDAGIVSLWTSKDPETQLVMKPQALFVP